MSRWPLAVLCVGLLGARAAAQTPQTITVESPTLKADQPIPRDYTADGRNVSPPLTWSGRAGGREAARRGLQDPDAGNPPPFVHWVIYKIPPTAKGLPENVPFEPDAPMPAGDCRRHPGGVGLPASDLSRSRAATGQGASLSLRRLCARRGARSEARIEPRGAAGGDQGTRRRPGRACRHVREKTMTFISRRDLLKRAAAVSALAVPERDASADATP